MSRPNIRLFESRTFDCRDWIFDTNVQFQLLLIQFELSVLAILKVRNLDSHFLRYYIQKCDSEASKVRSCQPLLCFAHMRKCAVIYSRKCDGPQPKARWNQSNFRLQNDRKFGDDTRTFDHDHRVFGTSELPDGSCSSVELEFTKLTVHEYHYHEKKTKPNLANRITSTRKKWHLLPVQMNLRSFSTTSTI